MRRRHYGKPLPPKRQVRAHLSLLQMISEETKMGMRIELSKVQVGYLMRLISVDFQRMNADMDHAISYGSDVVLPDFDTAGELLVRLENSG